MNYRIDWSIQDGKLSADTGRIIVYGNDIIHSNGPSRDHNDLITSFAARYRLSRDDVASKGFRFYWRPVTKGLITISPVRRIDEDWACNHVDMFNKLIDKEFGT
ncbi:MAG: hypothetical protein LBL28_08210 [Treponema sp.]|jgi:hypothetical protein|nr:hypothetical protein [Treponema sp.]